MLRLGAKMHPGKMLSGASAVCGVQQAADMSKEFTQPLLADLTQVTHTINSVNLNL